MPKLTIVLIAALAVALASCAKPTSYDDIAPLPRDAQLAVFAAASPAEKAAIYREHLTRYAARPTVTAAQREALLRSAALVSPDWYGLAPDAPGWNERVKAPGDEMERLLRAAFGEEAPRVMMAIGPE